MEGLINEDLLELEKELDDDDVKHLSTRHLTDFLSTSILPLTSQMIMMPTGRVVLKLPEEL
jgi:hypothetical protein